MKKTNISIVGSGNVGTHMALAFHAAGHTIRQVFSRSLDHAQLLAARVGAQAIDKPQQLDTDIDVCLLAVGDDALYDLALDLRLPHTLVLHTSGSTPMKVLAPVSARHGVMWSPQTFIRDIAMDYSTLPICIEGNTPKAETEIEELVCSVSSHIYHLNQEQRQHAHLAAVMVSNFTCAIDAMAQQYARQHGVPFEMLRPLAEQTLRKWDYGDLWAQMTGPARRRDEKTLNTHRRLLQDDPEASQLYGLLTDIIQCHC